MTMKQLLKFILFLFSVISIISTAAASQSNLFLSVFFNGYHESKVKSELFLKMIAFENHYYSQFLTEEEQSVFMDAVEIATNINLKDARSMIFDEVPGLFAMKSEIVVAGEGTDFTNLPIESSPPIEELLKDREVVEESLENILDDPPKKNIEKPDKNTVFIYHSHNRESFIPHIKDSNSAVTAQHKEVNITLVGERLANKLMEKGIGAVVDKTDIAKILAERNLPYTKSYEASREVVQEAMAQNKDLVYFLDIHRDSAKRNTTTTIINGKNYAKLYFIVGESHPGYKENEKFAIELNSLIKEKYPALTRGIFHKDKTEGNGVYNQDLSPNSLIIEIGGPENTLEEMYNTVDILAEVFAEYYWEKSEAVEVSN